MANSGKRDAIVCGGRERDWCGGGEARAARVSGAQKSDAPRRPSAQTCARLQLTLHKTSVFCSAHRTPHARSNRAALQQASSTAQNSSKAARRATHAHDRRPTGQDELFESPTARLQPLRRSGRIRCALRRAHARLASHRTTGLALHFFFFFFLLSTLPHTASGALCCVGRVLQWTQCRLPTSTRVLCCSRRRFSARPSQTHALAATCSQRSCT